MDRVPCQPRQLVTLVMGVGRSAMWLGWLRWRTWLAIPWQGGYVRLQESCITDGWSGVAWMSNVAETALLGASQGQGGLTGRSFHLRLGSGRPSRVLCVRRVDFDVLDSEQDAVDSEMEVV